MRTQDAAKHRVHDHRHRMSLHELRVRRFLCRHIARSVEYNSVLGVRRPERAPHLCLAYAQPAARRWSVVARYGDLERLLEDLQDAGLVV